MKVKPEDFIRIWQESKRVREVSEKTGLTMHSVKDKARRFRRKGIPLKEMVPRMKKLDYEGLIKLAKSLQK